MTIITITKKGAKDRNLVAIPRKEYNMLLEAFKILKEKKNVTEADVLKWSKEAKKLKKQNKLPVLHSLKNFR